MTPSPDIRVCLDCGWSEFIIPHAWMAAGWLRSLRPETDTAERRVTETRIVPTVPAPVIVM